jgi:hypothetical protein
MKLPAWTDGRLFDVWTPDDCRAGECSQGKTCKPKNHGKHPVKAGWQTAGHTGKRNTGCRTGDGIGVLDVDSLDAFVDLEQLYGTLPKGPRVRTGSGGLHVFFKVDRPLRNRRAFRPGLDWRGEGGYVVFPPSAHASGESYTPDGFDLELPDCPAWLADIVDGQNAASVRVQSDFDLDRYLRDVGPAISGAGGHDKMWHVVCTVVEKGQVRTWDEFRQVIATYNATCQPPWSEEELQHKFDDAMEQWEARDLVTVPLDRQGRPSQSFRWVLKIVREDKTTAGKLRRNLLGDVPEYDNKAITDGDVITITTDLLDRYGWNDLPVSKVQRAIDDIIQREAYSPVVEYLDSLEWDGVERLKHVASEVLGAPGELASEQVRRWLIAACARAYVPAIKFDHVLVLKGEQGKGKSSFFDVLGGGWYDETPVDLHNKDAMQSIGRCWLYCWDEIATSWGRKEVNLVKNFVTRRTDIYRPPFERHTKEVERRCIFAATTNDDELLYDSTGSRRFWIVDCAGVVKPKDGDQLEFDLDWLRANRDQLWAEAAAAFHALSEPKTAHLGLPRKLDAVRAEFNKRFEPEDVVFEKTLGHIDDMRKDKAYPGFVLLAELQDGLREKWERASVRKALHSLGFVSTTKRINGRVTRVWADPTAKEDKDD